MMPGNAVREAIQHYMTSFAGDNPKGLSTGNLEIIMARSPDSPVMPDTPVEVSLNDKLCFRLPASTFLTAVGIWRAHYLSMLKQDKPSLNPDINLQGITAYMLSKLPKSEDAITIDEAYMLMSEFLMLLKQYDIKPNGDMLFLQFTATLLGFCTGLVEKQQVVEILKMLKKA